MKTHRTRVDVTQDDIDEGRSSSDNCPVARALRRTFKVKGVDVNGGTLAIGDGKTFQHCRMPKRVAEFVRRYDYPLGKHEALPFTFFVPFK